MGPAKQKQGFRIFSDDIGRFPLEQRIENKRRGIGRQRYPVVVWSIAFCPLLRSRTDVVRRMLSAGMIGAFLYELARNWQEQGTPFSFKPTVNPLLGPSQDALVSFGARFPPCMKTVPSVPATIQLGCARAGVWASWVC